MALPKYKFELKDPSKDKTSIVFLFYFNSQKFKYGTSQIIWPELWDSETQRPTTNKKLIGEWSKEEPTIKTELESIANRLDNICQKVTEYFSLTERAGQKVILEDLRSKLNERFKDTPKPKIEKEEAKQPPFILELIHEYVKGMINGTVLISSPKAKRGQKYSQATVDLYVSFEKIYKEFDLEYGPHRVDQINSDYESDLFQYFEEKEYAPQQKGKLIARLKAIIHSYLKFQRGKSYEMEKDGKTPILKAIDLYHIEKELDGITKPNEKTQAVALYEDEIKKIVKLDLTQKSYLKRTRDVFLAGYFTVLRYSDFHRLDPRKHLKSGFIEIRAQKTKKLAKIEAVPELIAILDQYPEGFPKITAQEIGRNIKEICRVAGINEKIEILKRGQIEEKEKWQLIKTHTARRSGATRLYEQGVPLMEIMEITGHTKLDTLQNYIIPRKTKKVKGTKK